MKSICCKAETKLGGASDFIGDAHKSTRYYICSNCLNPCAVEKKTTLQESGKKAYQAFEEEKLSRIDLLESRIEKLELFINEVLIDQVFEPKKKSLIHDSVDFNNKIIVDLLKDNTGIKDLAIKDIVKKLGKKYKEKAPAKRTVETYVRQLLIKGVIEQINPKMKRNRMYRLIDK